MTMNLRNLVSKSLFTQENRLLTLHSPLVDAGLLLDHFEGREALSAPFEFTLSLLSERADLALKDFLGKPFGITLKTASGADRWFHGHLTSADHTGSDNGLATYRATLGPWTYALQHRVNRKVFNNKNVIAIVREVFGEYGALARWKLLAREEDFPARTMTLQYDESDFDFISRLLEEYGIYYYFKFEPNSHTLILASESRTSPDLPEARQLSYNSLPGAAKADTIDAWTLGERVAATDLTVTSFDFKNPRNHSPSSYHTHRPPVLPAMEHYLPVGAYGYKDFEHGEQLAKLRMEQLEQRSETYQGASNVRTLTCGHSFELLDHYRKAAALQDRQFLVLQVDHTGSNNYRNLGAGKAAYRNTFTCAPRSIRHRPAQTTPRPMIYGPQTATVVGAPGDEICTDQHGRVKIQFHWDRLGQSNDASSAWVRVSSPMAGHRFGFISVPRVGQEVVVDFLDGNPDRPLITGSVFNQQEVPPWDLPKHQTQSGILTRSSKGGTVDNANALRFEDKKGHEEVWLHAEKDQRIEVENDESHSVGHDRHKTIGNDEVTEVGHDRSEHVGNDEDVTIDGDQTIQVKRCKDETVNLASTEQVGGIKTLAVGAALAVTVGAGKTETVGLGSFEGVGQVKKTSVGSDYNIEVVNRLSITVGASSLVLEQNGTITLAGKQINITAEGPLKLSGKDIENN